MNDDATHMKLLPHDKEAEQGVLGTIIHDNGALHEITGVIEPEMFFTPAHREIFTAMFRLANDSSPIDEITLVDALRSADRLEAVGGPVYVAELRDLVPAASRVSVYAAIVREKWQARAMISLALELANSIRTTETVAPHLDGFRDGFAHVIHLGAETGEAQHISDALEDWVASKDTGTEARPTGRVYSYLTHLDKILGGIGTDRPTVIAARPGVGKTSLCVQIAVANAEHTVPALFLNLEMARDDIITRIVSAKSGIDGAALHSGQFSLFEDDAMGRILDTTTIIKGYPLWIHTPRRRMTRNMIEGVVMRAITRHGIRLVVIDQLSKIQAQGRDEFERQTARMNAVADVQKLAGVPFLLACQLKRPLKSDNPPPPSLEDLKGSGQIEEDAGVVIFLHDESSEKDRNDPHQVRMIVAKNGMGKTGQVHPPPQFTPGQCRFDDHWDQQESYV